MSRAEYEKKYGQKAPTGKSVKLGASPTPHQPEVKKNFGQKVVDTAFSVGDAITDFVGARGIADTYGHAIAKGMLNEEQEQFLAPPPTLKEAVGSGIQTASLFLPTGAAGVGAKGLLKAAGKGAAMGYGLDVGSNLQTDKSVGESLKPGLGTAIGTALPGAGALIKGAKKGIPAGLSFTSGVPKKAIETAMESPQAARLGRTGSSIESIRTTAVKELGSLRRELSKTFDKGLDDVVASTGQTKAGTIYDQKGFLKGSQSIKNRLVTSAKDFGREFRLGFKTTPKGVTVNFDKSPIVKAGERNNIQEAMNTLAKWDDFSARGMQDLAERIGALRNFESGAKTESSAILGKMYHRIAGTGAGNTKGVIQEFYPQLSQVRTNYAKNRKVLDAIDDVLQSSKTNPRAVQSSVTRLGQIFNEEKDIYMGLLKELSDRSGVDISGMLAGAEFQRFMPSFIRGLGGGGAVGVGAALINPWLILLAPLFSPRAVGKGIEVGMKSAPARKAAGEGIRKVAPLVGAELNQ